jgi:hypothetical protein
VSDGLPQASLIIGATAVFASMAWSAGMVRTPEPTCDHMVEVVQYLPIPQIEPIMKPPPLGWPVEDRALPSRYEPTVEKASVEETDDAEETPRRHHRRHRRHWR